ncbi:aggregation-promoting factor C-terminal-like domain-containing protein [Streptomyces silvisoli]|uniref:Transglycosylase SLT domain-containing protein n=1 Tax=Streptomyces silvisoli TaxID=3034235 RepID=A0ABT5ZLN4_9ACTN|nr:hypothetical protein [Streptomyces silvisoli]MDF3290746.1 hypothetical protein [Streptomyces silvisoli]
MPGEEYLPPVVAEFRADVDNAIRKIEEFRAAVDSVGSTSPRSIGRVESDAAAATRELEGTSRAAGDAERSIGRMGETSRRTATAARSDWDAWMAKMETLFPGLSSKWDAAFGDFKTKNEEAATRMQGDFRDAFKNIAERDARDAFKTIINDANKAGDDAGSGFASRFAKMIGDGNNGKGIFAGLAPGGARPNWGGLIAAFMPGIAPLAAGLAAPVVSGAVSALPGAAGSAGMLLFLKDAFGEVTKAAATLETQTAKYNSAADTTAQFLNSDAAAMTNYHQLLGQVTPQQADALQLLTQQDVTWQSLSLSQQQGIIQLRETTDLYKALTPSQQNSINALLAEKSAWDALEPSQAAALTQYQNMHDAYDNLRTLSMPSMFDMIASGERAATDAMQPLAPVIQQAALGWKDLADSADGWFRSPDYQKFVDMWSATTRASIDSFGRGIGNVALGFIHIWEALSPMIGPSLSWIDNFSAAFADWANTPAGAAALQHFMQDLQRNGPPTWQALGNIARTIGNIVSALAWNPVTMMMLNDLAQWMRDVTKNDLGKVAVQTLAWAMAIKTLAQQFQILAVAQAAIKWTSAPVGGTATAVGEGAALGAATRAVAPAGMATTASGLIVPAGAATTGEAAAAGGAASFLGISSESKIVQLIRDDLEMSFIPALGGAASAFTVALVGVALAAFHDASIRIRDAQNGVVENVDGSFSAATTVAGTHVSQSFRDLANRVANSTQSTGVTVEQGGVYAAARFGDYTQNWDKHNTAMIDTMYLGKTQAGQAFAIFAQGMHDNVAQLGASLKTQGKTINQAFMDTMNTVFLNLGGKTKASWADAEKNMTDGLDKYYASMRQTTTNDYNSTQKIVQQTIDDGYHHRTDLEKTDLTTLFTTITQVATDKNNGLIDTSKSNISKLMGDINQYLKDWTAQNSVAAGADLLRLGQDVSGKFSDMTDQIQQSASHKFDQEIASAQADISRIQSSIPLPFTQHAAGGLITGPGSGTSDSIPAWLSNGEFVVNAKSTSKFLPLLHSINSHFASGGLVGGDMGVMWSLGDQRSIAEQMAMLNQIQQAQAAAQATALGHGVGPGGQQAIAYAASRLALHGWGQNQLGPLIKLWDQESGWNSYAVNPSSGAYGIPQSLGHGHPYDLGDYKAQVDWGLNYIASSYGSPAAAWGHEMAYNWYDQGGLLPPGRSTAVNGTGAPERVLTQSQWSTLATLAAAGAQAVAGGVTVPVVVTIDGKKVYEAVRTVGWQNQRRNGRNVWEVSR